MSASPIATSRLVAAPPDTVFRYLEDLANHARLAPRTAELMKLDRRPGHLDRATVRLLGPLGLRRTASTELVRTEPPRLIAGRATVGTRTTASVSWTIAAAPAGSVVSLSAAIGATGPIDSLVLHLGGRRWIARRFSLALDRLAAQLDVASAREEYERGLGGVVRGVCDPAVRTRKSRRLGDDRSASGDQHFGGPNPEPQGPRMNRFLSVGATAGLLVALAVITAGAASSSTAAPDVQPPPEWAANAGAWPAHNYDLANTRATTQTPINSQTVSNLKVKWTFALKGASAFGIFASTPISLNGTVYLQDLNSNVYALDRSTGKLKWKHSFNKPSVGPNGVAYGNGRIYGATETSAFALDAQTGKLLWSRKLTRNNREGIDMAPQVYDNNVLFSTVPGNGLTSFYQGGALGAVWALDSATGKPKWTFNTVQDGAKLWGNPKVNSGGGLWYPPSVDSQGRVFISVANPAPLYGTKKFPNGTSRPGPDLYTNSVVALDGQTGKLLWFHQALPHDIRDYDLMVPAILTTIPVQAVPTDAVLV